MGSWQIVAAGVRCWPEDPEAALDQYRLAVELAPTRVSVGVSPEAHIADAEAEWQRAAESYVRGHVHVRLEIFADFQVADEVVRVEDCEGGFWIYSEDELQRRAADAAFDAIPMLLDDLLDDVLTEDSDQAEIACLLADSQRREVFERLPFEVQASEALIDAVRAPPKPRAKPPPPVR